MQKHREMLPVQEGWSMGILPHEKARDLSVCTLSQLSQCTEVYPATVPGCMELDLQRAGLVEDPYFADNVLKLQDLEEYHAYYTVSFTLKETPGTKPVLVFEGLDTICEIYLNGTWLGRTENMLIPHRFSLNAAKPGRNELFVHFLPSCIVARDYPLAPGYYSHNLSNYEMLRLRKAPHMFGWDISPRIVSAGIWRPVYVEYVPEEHIDDLYFMTLSEDGDGKTAMLDMYFSLNIRAGLLREYSLRIRGVCGDSSFSQDLPLRFTKGVSRIRVERARLWWPKGRGEQNLYQTSVELMRGSQVLDRWDQAVGVRTVSLERTAVTDVRHNGKFQFRINKEPVFVMGTNWVQLDSFHCNDEARVEQAIALTDDIGCNAVRCWGGNVYESEKFFDLCDQKGIMVWQDFSFACAVYPQDKAMFDAVEKEIRTVLPRLRRHPCIVLWAGDNECDLLMSRCVGDRDPNCNRLTRNVIKELVEFEDPTRPYLPSSPFYDEEAYQIGRQYITENHLWGPRDYYKSNFYTQSLCHFVSEIGYHGCPSPESVRKFISPEHLWPWQDNPEWIIHAANDSADPNAVYAYRIPLMAKQIRELFGQIPDNLEEFSLASQISQAEAKKFFIEMFRQQNSYRTGIIWWNLLDCWPQFSDAVVDYYFEKKLAYDYIKRAQQPLLVFIGEPSHWKQPLLAVNDSKRLRRFDYECLDVQSGELVCRGQAELAADSSQVLAELPYSQGVKKLYILRWTCEDGTVGVNHYLAGNPPFELQEYCALMKRYGLL